MNLSYEVVITTETYPTSLSSLLPSQAEYAGVGQPASFDLIGKSSYVPRDGHHDQLDQDELT